MKAMEVTTVSKVETAVAGVLCPCYLHRSFTFVTWNYN